MLIPSFKEFGTRKQLKFHLFKFHDKFDGLIGLDILKYLNVQLDFINSKFKMPCSELDINYYLSQTNVTFNADVKAHTGHRIRIPVNIDKGYILIPQQKIQHLEIMHCLTQAHQGYAWTEIVNKQENDISLTMHEPLQVQQIDLDDFEIFHIDLKPNDLNDYNNHSEINNLIRTDHLNSEEKLSIEKLCKKYSDIFKYEDEPLTFTNQIKHQIKTTDEIPVYTKSYRYPFIHKPEIEKQINSMLEQGIIRHSNSPWSSPIWIVPKKADASGKKKWRIVVDYRKVNEKTVDDRYPIPNISDILDKLGKCQYFSTLDLASGYYQIEMASEDIPKTAFNVENGHYEYVRLPMGLKNAPATFQRVMDNTLKGLQNDICLVYMDDIVIFSVSLQEHIINLRKVFQRLRETNLKIQLDKSEFLKKEVAFLGHIVTPDGVKPNPDKIKAILNYPIPKTIKEIKGFLGLLGYYRKFIKNFAKLAKPLTLCLKKGSKIEHNEAFLKCFDECRNILTNEPLLQYPDFTKPFNLTTDASNFAIGAILSQGPIGSDKPIAYASRTLNSAEQNFSVIEKEALSVLFGTKTFRCYLFGRKFKVITDHKPLEWLMNLKEPNSRLVRWRLKLEEFDYEIQYKKGKLNTNADALSRIEINTKEVVETPDNDNMSIINNIDENPNMDEVDSNSSDKNDEYYVVDDLDDIQENIENVENEEDQTAHSSIENPIQIIHISEKPLNLYNNQIIIEFILYADSKLHQRVHTKNIFNNKKRIQVKIDKNTLRSEIINFMKNYLKPKLCYAILFKTDELYPEICNIIKDTFKNSCYKLIKCNSILKDVTDESRQQEIITHHHEGKSNHRGIPETTMKIKQNYYWPTLNADIEDRINNCDICQINKYDRNPIRQQYSLTPTAKKPFEIVNVDTFQASNQKFLTIIDSFSKYAQAYPLDSLNAVNIIKNLLIFMTHHGTPLKIISDNGTEFKNNLVLEFVKLHNIDIHFTTPSNPQSNGTLERFHSTLIEHLRVLRSKQPNEKSIINLMPYAVLGYNNSFHSVTKQKPISVINGHLDTKDPFDIEVNQVLLNNYIENHKEKTKLIYEKIHEISQHQKEKTITKRNESREKEPDIQPQTKIYKKVATRNKLTPKYTPEIVVQQNVKTISTNKSAAISKQNIKRPKVIRNPLLQTISDNTGEASGSRDN